jgi:hypothetical protein
VIRQATIPVVLLVCTSAQGQQAQSKIPITGPRVKEPALRQELLAMEKKDQEARMSFLRSLEEHGIGPRNGDPKFKDPALIKLVMEQTAKLAELDRKNTARLGEIVDKFGWPGQSLVGIQGTEAAWLLVQHADANVPFQKQCLKLMKAGRKGDVNPRHIAYLTDRILVHEGKMQMYGTQVQGQGGDIKPLPIADEANVDKRRADVGMEPLAEYLRNHRQLNEKLSGSQKQTKGKD